MIAEFQKSDAAPSEFLKSQINKAGSTAFHNKHAATTLSKETVHNVSRETEAKVKKDMGLSERALSNLFLIQEARCAEDVQSRARLFDASKNLLGIVRNISVAPAVTGPSGGFEMSLWTKHSCIVCQELAALGPIILSSDATGGLLNFPLVDSIKGKVLHTKVNIIPKHALVESTAIAISDPILSRNLSPLTLAEFVQRMIMSFISSLLFQRVCPFCLRVG
jgi:hypothetical protein